MRIRFFLTLFICLLPELPAFALTNSQPAVNEIWQSSVMIRTEGRDLESGGSTPAYCNGTIISPRLILTAAHCVLEAHLLNKKLVGIELGKYKFVTRPDGKIARVGYVPFLKTEAEAQFYFLPEIERRLNSQKFSINLGPSEDLAIIYLSEPLVLAGDFPFAKVFPSSGWQSFINNFSAYSLIVVTVNYMAEMSTDTKRLSILDNAKFKYDGWVESISSSRVEPMDSGSGLFVSTVEGPLWIGAVKGRGESWFSNWDAFSVGVQHLCNLGKTKNLPTDQIQLLCR